MWLGTCPASARATVVAPEQVSSDGPLKLHGQLDLAALERIVVAGAAELSVAKREAAMARAEARQARILANPTLDAGQGTIPIGKTTPVDLPMPMRNVPNYSAGISYTFPLGKRGLRIAHAQALANAAAYDVQAQRRLLALELARIVGELAVVGLHLDLVRAWDSRDQNLRLRGGTGHPTSEMLNEALGRVQVIREGGENGRLALAARQHLLLSHCAGLAGRECQPFATVEEAWSFLDLWTRAVLTSSTTEPLAAEVEGWKRRVQAAHFTLKLAQRFAIPEPTLRFGYMHDRFIISGNQRNSLGFSVFIPLPVFDRGQAQVASAQALVEGTQNEVARRVQAFRAQVRPLCAWIKAEVARLHYLQERTLPSTHAEYVQAEQRWVRGEGSLDDLEAAWDRLDLAQSEELGVALRVHEASVALARVLPSAGAKGCGPEPTREPQ